MHGSRFGTGQRNLSAALLVGASFGDTDTLVMTLVASLLLAVLLVVVGGEMGKRVVPEPNTSG